MTLPVNTCHPGEPWIECPEGDPQRGQMLECAGCRRELDAYLAPFGWKIGDRSTVGVVKDVSAYTTRPAGPGWQRPHAIVELDDGTTVVRGLDNLKHVPPEIVCLCGSTRFMDAYAEHYGRLTDEGKIVLTVGRVVPQSEQALGSERKAALDELHKRKIDLADRIFVLNVGGYVGASTRSEIEYAKAHRKPITYLEPV